MIISYYVLISYGTWSGPIASIMEIAQEVFLEEFDQAIQNYSWKCLIYSVIYPVA